VGKLIRKMKGGGQFILTEKGDIVTNIKNNAPIYIGHIDNFKIKYEENKDMSLKFEDVFE